MSTQERLIQALQEKFPNESQAGIARIAGLQPPRFNNYVTGIRTMDVDAIIGCAQALGWDIRATVASHLQETAHSPREKALWRKLAATAASLLVGVLVALPLHADAATDGFEQGRSMHYAKSYIDRRGCDFQKTMSVLSLV